MSGSSEACHAPESGNVVKAVLGKDPNQRYRHVGTLLDILIFARVAAGQLNDLRLNAVQKISGYEMLARVAITLKIPAS